VAVDWRNDNTRQGAAENQPSPLLARLLVRRLGGFMWRAARPSPWQTLPLPLLITPMSPLQIELLRSTCASAEHQDHALDLSPLAAICR
jgi:hypothetical protein